MNSASQLRVAGFVCATAALAVGAAACGGGGGSPAVAPTPTQTPFTQVSPVPAQHLYVGYQPNDGSNALAIVEYALPLSNGSSPILTVPADGSVASFAVDPVRGTIAEAITANGLPAGIRFLAPPLSATPHPLVTIPAGPATVPSSISGMGFDPAGNLWVATQQDLREFTLPFTSYATAATIIPNGVPGTPLASFFAAQPVFDTSTGAMYVRNAAGLGSASVFVFAPPTYTASPQRITPPFALGPIAFDGIGNAVASFTFPALPTPGPAGTPLPISGMGVFSLPLASQALPSIVFPLPDVSGLTSAVSDAIAGVGNVYLSDSTDGTIFSYTLPVAPNATPAVHTSCPSTLRSCGSPFITTVLQLSP